MYELKTGKFGQYFYNTYEKRDMPLEDILVLLHHYSGRIRLDHKDIIKLKLENFVDKLADKESEK